MNTFYLVINKNFVCVPVNWLDIHARIRVMIKSAFESVALVHPEMHNPMFRAMYGVDVMLDTNFQPKLLEVCNCHKEGYVCDPENEECQV